MNIRPPFQAPIMDASGAVSREWLLFFTLISTAATAWQPPSFTDANAANNSVYYSTTASKLVYKDSGGVVHALY